MDATPPTTPAWRPYRHTRAWPPRARNMIYCADCGAEYDQLSEPTGHDCDPLWLEAMQESLRRDDEDDNA